MNAVLEVAFWLVILVAGYFAACLLVELTCRGIDKLDDEDWRKPGRWEE